MTALRSRLQEALNKVDEVCESISEAVGDPKAFAHAKFNFDCKADVLLNFVTERQLQEKK